MAIGLVHFVCRLKLHSKCCVGVFSFNQPKCLSVAFIGPEHGSIMHLRCCTEESPIYEMCAVKPLFQPNLILCHERSMLQTCMDGPF